MEITAAQPHATRHVVPSRTRVEELSGSGVTRDVADIVPVDDSFAALLLAQREGRRIINGLTGPARPVLHTVLPALLLWFLTLSAAYRFRWLDRLLGLDALHDTCGPFATDEHS